MPLQDAISETRLSAVHPELARRVRAAADRLAAEGEYFRVAEGLRSYQRSDELYAQGRTAPGKIVTNARAGYSAHNFGFAVDCFPFVEGSAGTLNFIPDSPQFQRMVAALKAECLVWGGDWKHISDPPHFQLVEVPVTPTIQDRIAFAHGGMEAVWMGYPNLSCKLDLYAAADWHTATTIAQIFSGIGTLLSPRFWRNVRWAWRHTRHHARHAHTVLTRLPKP